jgi:phosphatidate cytidylyltransferase
MVGYGWIVQTISRGTVTANYLTLAISGLFIAIVAQVGDLLMSAIKRTFGIKDYGKLFPGHGGVLDRFDSVMAVALVLAVISSITNLFTVTIC